MNKKGLLIQWFIGIIIVIILIWFLNTKLNNKEFDLGSDVKEVKEKVTEEVKEVVKPLTIKEATLMSRCNNSFDECKWITNQKYGFSLSIIKIQEFKDEEGISEFYEIWAGEFIKDIDVALTYSKTIYGYEWNVKDNLPIVLMAIKLKKDDFQIPIVAICDKYGELIKPSKKSLSCG